MHSVIKSPLILLYAGLIYFPSGLLYIGESDFFFEKFTVFVLFVCSLFGLSRKNMRSDTSVLLAIFLFFMLMSAMLNIVDLAASENGVLDAFAQIFRIFVYVGVAQYIGSSLSVKYDQQKLETLVISIIRITVYGQALLLLARAMGFGAIINSLFITKSILFSGEVSGILKYDGSLGNPNYFGYLLCLAMLAIFFMRKRVPTKEFIFLSIITIGMILISGSRTAFIVLLVELALFYPISFSIILVSLLPVVEVVVQVNDRIYELFEAVVAAGSVETFEIRRELVDRGLSYVSHRPFFGFGYRPIEMTDNFYITHLMRYGWAGSVVHIAILIFIVYRQSPSKYFMLCFLAPVVFFNYTGAFIDNFRLYFATILLFIACSKINLLFSQEKNCTSLSLKNSARVKSVIFQS